MRVVLCHIMKTADVANSLKVFNPKGWRVVTEALGDDSGN